MKTQITVEQLGAMDVEQFIAHVQQYPLGSQWVSAAAFRYAATRLARMQGLILGKEKECGCTVSSRFCPIHSY